MGRGEGLVLLAGVAGGTDPAGALAVLGLAGGAAAGPGMRGTELGEAAGAVRVGLGAAGREGGTGAFEARAALRLTPEGKAPQPLVLTGAPAGDAASCLVERVGILNAWAPWRHRASCVAAAARVLAEGARAEEAVLVAAVPGEGLPTGPCQLRAPGAPDLGLPPAPVGLAMTCAACAAAHAALTAQGFRVTLVLGRGFRPPGRDLTASRRTAAALGGPIGDALGLYYESEPAVAATALDFEPPAGHADPDFPNMYV